MDANICNVNFWTLILNPTLIGALVGAFSAIAGSFISNYQQARQKETDYKNKQLKTAYSITEQLLNDTEILIETKGPLLKLYPKDPGDFYYDNYYDPAEDHYTGIAFSIDRKKRKVGEFFDMNDLNKTEELKLLCDLYTDDKTSSIVNNIYNSIKRQDAIFEDIFSNGEPGACGEMVNGLVSLKNLLIELKKELRKFLPNQ